MFAFPDGRWPFNPIVIAARACVIGVACFASGCAASKSPSYVAGPMQTRPHVQQAAAVPVPSETEADGKPAQVPGRQMRPEEDDPSEPWSSNYGKGVNPRPPRAPARTIDALAPAPRLASPRVQMSAADEDMIIARAISAHEMRNQ